MRCLVIITSASLLQMLLISFSGQPNREPDFVSVAPLKVDLLEDEKASVLNDKSVFFEGDVGSSRAICEFRFRNQAKVDRLRLQVLPNPLRKDKSLSRSGNGKLVLFDLNPSKTHNGKEIPLQFDECSCFAPKRLSKADEIVDYLDASIDFLSDTGLELPHKLRPGESHIALEFRFLEPVAFETGDVLSLQLDSGGSSEFQLFSRVRFQFPSSEAKLISNSR